MPVQEACSEVLPAQLWLKKSDLNEVLIKRQASGKKAAGRPVQMEGHMHTFCGSMCMCICAHVCVCLCMYSCLYLHMYVRHNILVLSWVSITSVCVCLCLCVYVNICVCVCSYVCIYHTYVFVYQCMYICRYV